MAWDEFKKLVEKHGGIPVDPVEDPEADEGDIEVWVLMTWEGDDDLLEEDPIFRGEPDVVFRNASQAPEEAVG
jgi:hypothetical protein